nr:diguanylate cyclase [Leptothrix sp. C29]
MRDDAGRLDFDTARALAGQAQAAGTPRANFGEYPGTLWIFLDLEVGAQAAGEWLLDVAYPALDEVDLQLLRDDRPVTLLHTGDRLRGSARALLARTHLLPLSLQAGRHRLVLRVHTSGSLIAPLQLVVPEVHRRSEERAQLVQGLAAGVMLSLLLYSLAQWYSLRDRMFVYYGLSVLSLGLFQIAFHGIGMQHLWSEHPDLAERLPPVCVLLGITGTFLFVDRALGIAEVLPRLSRLMHAGGLVCAAAALLVLCDLLSYRDGQRIAKVLGQLPTLLALPVAWRRWRQGDAAAGYLLAGWTVYTSGVLVLALLISGRLPATPLVLHGFQIASLTEMVMWLVVTGVRVAALRRAAEQVRHDGERLRRLAETDALTGLLNRRGLQQAAGPALARARPGHATALFLLDLDGFKPVNDRFGHQAGDQVLAEVARRLQAQVRQSDLVARIGGDEFVVMATGLPDEPAALRLGQALLDAIAPDIEVVQGPPCRVGATIGLAMVPADGHDIAVLLERADQAMYAGKQAGKRQVRRFT